GEAGAPHVEGRRGFRARGGRPRAEFDPSLEGEPLLVRVVAVRIPRERIARTLYVDGLVAPEEFLLAVPGGAVGRAHVAHPRLDPDRPLGRRPFALDVTLGLLHGD